MNLSKRSVKNATLVEADIPGLRKRIHTKQSTPSEEADRYGVGVETIRRAVRGETFRHIRPEPDERSLPSDLDLLRDAEASLRRVQESNAGSDAGSDAVEEFLTRRPLPNPLDEEPKK